MNKKKTKQNKEDKKKGKEVDEVRAQLARALADYDNLRKRIEKERADYERILKIRIITKFLQVFDMLDEVQEHLKDTGLGIAINTFREILDSEKVEEIQASPGVEFDENLHEAVEIISVEDKKDNEIVELMQTGWKFKDGQVLRYAKVKVNKKGEE